MILVASEAGIDFSLLFQSASSPNFYTLTHLLNEHDYLLTLKLK